FGEETGLRHAVVWVFADHGGADPAVWGPHVWKVNPYFCFHPANSSEPTLRLPFLGFPGRFGDLFGARAALSVACASTVLFFLLLAVADHPAMLFIHKLPTLFMHVIPGERLMESQFKAQNQNLSLPCSFSDGRRRPVGTGKESGRFVQTGPVFWDRNGCWFHAGRQPQHSLR
ncbi:unnamed protein product, partial [Tetraodon nigroviridis]